MKKNSNSRTKSGQKTKLTKARGLVQRDSKEVMAELVAKLSERLEHTIFGCPTICMKFTRTDPRLEARDGQLLGKTSHNAVSDQCHIGDYPQPDHFCVTENLGLTRKHVLA